MRSCPKCSKVIADNSLTECNSCNMDLSKVVCSNCSSVIDMTSDLCDSCGNYMHRQFYVITDSTLSNDQMINSRYRVLDSDSKLVKDMMPNNHRFYSESVKNNDLLNIYKTTSKLQSVPRVYDAFHSQGNDYLIIQIHKDNYGQELRNIREIMYDSNDREKLQVLRDIANLYNIFTESNISGSVLEPDNLYLDDTFNVKIKYIILNSSDPSLKDISSLWEKITGLSGINLIEYSKYKIVELLRQIKDGRVSEINDLLSKMDILLDKPLNDLEHYAQSNPGRRRTNNEDNFYAFTSKFSETGVNRRYNGYKGLYILCDGMGGHESGEVASAEAISAIRASILPLLPFELGFEDIRKLFEESIVNKANEVIYQLNESQNRKLEKRMGTTVVLGLVIDNRLYVGHVGDSRVYLVTKDQFSQITEDHNVAMKNYRDGFGSFEDAIRNTSTRWGKVLTQALGPRSGDTIVPEINAFTLSNDCYLIFCSDGLTDMIPDQEIHEIIKNNWDLPENVVNSLIDKANENGGKDNITIVAVKSLTKNKVFPEVDYVEVMYDNDIDVKDEIVELVDVKEKSLEGLNIEPTAD